MTTTLEQINMLRISLKYLARVVIKTILDTLWFHQINAKPIEILPDKPWPRPSEPPIKIPDGMIECPTCHGSGSVEIHETRLTYCEKTTRTFDQDCEDCDGTGYVVEYSKSVYEI